MNGGNGTMTPSHALAVYLNKKGVNSKVIDIMNEANPLGEILGNVYNFLLRHSIFYSTIYMNFAHKFPINNFKPFNAIGRMRTVNVIEKEKSDAIVMISPWISKMVIQAIDNTYKKGKKRPLLIINIVDLGEKISTSWINNNADFTILPTEQAKKYLSNNGLNLEKSMVLGVPLHEEFSSGSINEKEKHKARSKFGIKENKLVISVLGGREGVSNTTKILKSLLKEIPNYDYMVQCGLNRRLYLKINKIAYDRNNVHPLGFVDSMRELYALSDVVITKPGAITVSELTVSKVPFILDTWPVIMPQEYGNVVFVRDNKLGLIANTVEEIPKLVQKILLNKSIKYDNKSYMKKLYGTEKIGDLIINTLNK
jgi:processive 1,2-diacylglycerol beta-glucosyltransferase